jgi:signal transduction histidine kinase
MRLHSIQWARKSDMTLAACLARHRSPLAHAWADRVLAHPDNHYRDWPVDEVVGWAEAAIDAVITREQAGANGSVDAHALALSRARAEQHFEIDQVIEGLLLLGESALPFLEQESHGDQAWLAVSTAQLYGCLRRMVARFASRFVGTMRAQQERVSVLEERQRLARDLHDSVSQSICGVQLYAEAASRLLAAGQPAAAAAYVTDVRESAADALREMRLLIDDLRPSVLGTDGLAAALQSRIEAVESRVGVHAALVASGTARPEPAVEEALYGIAREALNNGVRHARASRIVVRLSLGEGETRLDIEDDGRGFDRAVAGHSGGLGLRGMAERATRAGARLDIDTCPGGGTRIHVTAPRGGLPRGSGGDRGTA